MSTTIDDQREAFLAWVTEIEAHATRVAGMLPSPWMAHEAAALRARIAEKRWQLRTEQVAAERRRAFDTLPDDYEAPHG